MEIIIAGLLIIIIALLVNIQHFLRTIIKQMDDYLGNGGPDKQDHDAVYITVEKILEKLNR